MIDNIPNQLTDKGVMAHEKRREKMRNIFTICYSRGEANEVGYFIMKYKS